MSTFFNSKSTQKPEEPVFLPFYTMIAFMCCSRYLTILTRA